MDEESERQFEKAEKEHDAEVKHSVVDAEIHKRDVRAVVPIWPVTGSEIERAPVVIDDRQWACAICGSAVTAATCPVDGNTKP